MAVLLTVLLGRNTDLYYKLYLYYLHYKLYLYCIISCAYSRKMAKEEAAALLVGGGTGDGLESEYFM